MGAGEEDGRLNWSTTSSAKRTDATGLQNGGHMFYKKCDEGYRDALRGIELKTLTYGDKTLLTEFRMKAGSDLPMHSHPHEQTGYLVSGRIRLTAGAETFDAGPGDSWSIPGGIEHRAEIIEDTIAIEVFSPVRQEYLPPHAQS